MTTLLHDLRFAARSLRRTPAFTAVAVATLALGIGANTAIFSVVDTVLLRPLPFADPDRLVELWQSSPELGKSQSYPEVAEWRAMNRVFAGIGTTRFENFSLDGDTSSSPLHVRGASVSSELIPILGVAPALGRPFTPAEDRPGPRSVILSDDLWRRRFGADPTLVGKSVSIDGRSYAVAGVMPAGFHFPIQARAIELWVNSGIDAERSPATPNEKSMAEERGWHALKTIARLKPGATVERARAEMGAIVRTLDRRYPDEDAHRDVELAPLHQALVKDLRPALLILFGAVGCVLLIACANIANLLLAKSAAREKELAVRAAIGASRAQVIRQLLTESLLLAAVGGIAGTLFARGAINLLVAYGPRDLPRLSQVHLDSWVLLFTALLTIATGVVFGLAPALRAHPARLADSLKDGGHGMTAGSRQNRLRSSLVVAEVSLSLVLLAGAGLLLQSFVRLGRVDPGFEPEGVLSMRVDLPDRKYSTPERLGSFFDDVLARTSGLSGIRAVAAAGPLPMSGGNMGTSFEIDGHALPKSELPQTDFHVVTPRFFQTMGIAVRAGREFDSGDRLTSEPVTIINSTLARRFFAGVDPIGRKIKPGITALPGEPPFRRIVGVVADVKHGNLSEPEEPQLYLPESQVPLGSMTFVARITAPPSDAGRRLEAAIHEVDATLPVYDVKPVGEYLSQSVARPRFQAVLLALFAALALVLTAVGLYGVLSYSVAQRTHEIGIRRALGADRPAVMRLVVGQGMRLAGIGLLLGVLGALAATRLLASLLFEISPSDATTLVAVASSLGAVALAASWMPARRAAKIDPLTALRHE